MKQITVIRSAVEKQPKGYYVATISYKNDEGKTKGMKVLDFLQPEVFKAVSEVKTGDVLDVEFEQNDKGYWQFKAVAKSAQQVPSAEREVSQKQLVAKSNWETSEERAARQVMIVRQSSLSNAVALLAYMPSKEDPTSAAVIAVAKQFEAYVLDQTKDIE